MAGFWPALIIGSLWWFHDSPRGIARYLDAVVESVGFFKLAGFNDDKRALLSIPARHDVWRRGVASFLAGMVARRTLSMTDAHAVAAWLSVEAARSISTSAPSERPIQFHALMRAGGSRRRDMAAAGSRRIGRVGCAVVTCQFPAVSSDHEGAEAAYPHGATKQTNRQRGRPVETQGVLQFSDKQ